MRIGKVLVAGALKLGGLIATFAAPLAPVFGAPVYGVTALGTLGGTYSYGYGINASGQVTGYSGTSTGAYNAFLYTEGAMLDLDALLAPSSPIAGQITLQIGEGINDAGQIVANGCYNSGPCEAFLLTPYSLASGSVMPSPVTLGNQHVGGSAQQTLTVTNTATANGYSEGLLASAGTGTGAAATSGSTGLIAAGNSDSPSITLGVDTSSAGHKTGSVSIDLESDGAGTEGEGVTALSPASVSVSGNVYRYAAPSIAPLNLGAFHVGTSSVSGNLTVADLNISDLALEIPRRPAIQITCDAR